MLRSKISFVAVLLNKRQDNLANSDFSLRDIKKQPNLNCKTYLYIIVV